MAYSADYERKTVSALSANTDNIKGQLKITLPNINGPIVIHPETETSQINGLKDFIDNYFIEKGMLST